MEAGGRDRAGPHASIGYRPGLDGLRAIAVLAVMVYHAAPGALPGGYLGVDVFFVLSGFLITSLLLEERARTGRVDLVAFWGRRARRLLPAIVLVVVACAAYGRTGANPLALDRYRGDALATLAFFNNWHYAHSGLSYFEQFGTFASPLRHTWSLAIEEQFYVVWPVCFALVAWRFATARRSTGVMLALVGAGIVASVAAMASSYDPADQSRAYFGTDTRAHTILVGVALALLVHRVRPRMSTGLRRAAVPAALLLTALLAGARDDAAWMYRGGFLLAALVAGVVVIAAADNGSPVAAALGIRPLVLIGGISYGLYLWHWPWFVALESTSLEGPALRVAQFGGTAVLAVVSYFVVERPVRTWRPRLPGALHHWRVAAGVTAVGLAAAVWGLRTPTQAVGFVEQAGATGPSSTASTATATAGPAPVAPARILFAGDSTMFTLNFFGRWTDVIRGETAAWAPIGCGFLRADRVRGDGTKPECDDWPEVWAEQVEQSDPDLVVLQLGLWDASEHEVGGIELVPGTAEFARYFTQELDLAADVATARGGRLVVLDLPCLDAVDRADRDALNELAGQAARGRPEHIGVVTWSELLCADPSLRPDGAHVDGRSGPIVSRWLAPRLASEARGARPVDDCAAALSVAGP